MPIEVHLFLPQMRMSLEAMVGKAQAAEAAGFGGVALMDHLAPPMAEQQPMWDAYGHRHLAGRPHLPR